MQGAPLSRIMRAEVVISGYNQFSVKNYRSYWEERIRCR